MRLKSIFLLLLIVVSALAFIFSETGCASIVPPSGGPRDTLPPIIVSVNPPNETKNFNEKQIKIDFDEYIELEDAYKNLIISPLPKVMPEVTRKLKTVTVKIKDTLEENTTYVYNFARVIKDLNEGNRGKDLLYVVSTGNYFDSLQLSGNVKMAKTGKADSTLTVMLYNDLDDSAVVKERPRYITRVDTTGTFFFRYLKPGTYRLYAMKDEGGSYLYNGEQTFAFADSAVVIGSVPPAPIRLWAYEPEKKAEQTTEDVQLNKKEKRLKYTTNLDNNKQDILQAFKMTFESPLKNFDSSKLHLSMDSSFTPATGQRFSLDSTRRVMTMNMQWIQDTTYNLIIEKDFASDSLDRTLFKADTLKFKTKAKDDYGEVKITFVDVDLSRNPVLLILQGESIKDSFPVPSNRIINLQYYLPGEYDMQLLYDTNKNGRWDPGNFFKHLQPELIDPISRKLTVKPLSLGVPLDFEIKMGK